MGHINASDSINLEEDIVTFL